MHAIWLVLGVSGAGKSHFSRHAAEALSWFHYEIDMPPHHGIMHWGLRAVWDAYYHHANFGPLQEELALRSCNHACGGSILSFPGTLLPNFKEKHVAALPPTARLLVLAGPETACRASFVARERQTGRNLPASHWDAYNLGLYPMLEHPWLVPHVRSAFHPDGSRLSVGELLAGLKTAT